MGSTVLNPISISALSSTGRTEVQPARLALTGATNWSDSASSPSTKVDNIFTRARPIFYSFIIPRTYLAQITAIKAINLTIQVHRQTLGGSSFLRMAVVPFPFRYCNLNVSNQLDSSTKVSGINPTSVSNFAANIETYWEYTNSPISISSNLEFALNFNSDIDGFEEGFPIAATTGFNVNSPKTLEYLRNLLAQDNKDPIITIAVFPSNSDQYLAIENKSGSYLNTLTMVFYDSKFANIANNVFKGQSFSPISSIKEKGLGELYYSLGLATPYNQNNPNGNGGTELLASDPIGKYLVAAAHVGSQAIYAEDEKINKVFNGHFTFPLRSSVSYTAFNGASITQSNACPGWECYSGQTGTTNVSIVQSTLLKSQMPFKTDDQKTANMLDITMSDLTITPWTFTLFGGPSDITPTYTQYSTILQNLGNQLEFNEEYLLEAWVKPYVGNSSKSKIRMSYLCPWTDVPSGGGGSIQLCTGTVGAEVSSDAVIDGTWQRLWIRIKLKHSNAWGMIRYLYQKASTEIFTKAGDPGWNSNFVIAPPDKQCDLKQTFGMIRFDHIPINNPTTDKQLVKFMLCNVSLTKLNNRDTSVSSVSNAEYKPQVWDLPVSNARWWLDEPADWILPLRHANTSGTAPSIGYNMKSATENSTISPTYNAGIETIYWYDNTDLGFKCPKIKAETVFRFWTHKISSISEFTRGSSLVYQIPAGNIINPNEGSIEFWYSPHSFASIQDGLYLTNQGVPTAHPSANYYDPSYGLCYRNHLIDNNGDSINTDLGYGVGNIVYHSTMKNILTIGRNETFGSIFVGPGITIYRKQKNLGVLIYTNDTEQALHTNAEFMSYPNRMKFIRLEYLIPDSLFRSNTYINNPTPVWFRIKFTWGARQELYVNGELVDFNNVGGLFGAPAPIDTSNDILTTNLNFDTLWLGTIGSPKPISESLRPVIYSDNFIMTDLMIYGKARHQTRVASMASGSTQNSWLNLETLTELSTGTMSSVINPSGLSYSITDPNIGPPA